MIPSKAALAIAACLAGVVSGSIAAAQADTSSTGATGTTGTTGTPATITVNGAAPATADSNDTTATVEASYLAALGNALTDAHTKAAALASAVGDTLGSVENITEQSSDNGGLCYGQVFARAGTSSGAPVPAVSPGSKKKKKSHPSVKKASTLAIPAIARIADDTTTSCTIEADVTVTYAMAPSS